MSSYVKLLYATGCYYYLRELHMLTCSSSSERQRPAAVRLRVLPATCSDVQYSQMEINTFFETRLTVMDFFDILLCIPRQEVRSVVTYCREHA